MTARWNWAFVIAACFLAAPAYSQSALDTAPQMGLSSSGLYGVDKLETIDRVNGNVMYRIPLAALPKVGSAEPFQLELIYNSQNLRATYSYISDVRLGPNQFATKANLFVDQGWSFNYNYSLVEEIRPQPPASPGICTTANYKVYRLYLQTPDGARHYLSLYGNTSDEGYYAVDPIGGLIYSCSSPPTQPVTTPLTYFTDDSTFMRVTIANPGQGVNTQWTADLPSGSAVTGVVVSGLGNNPLPLSITDRNNNVTNITENAAGNLTTISNAAGSITITGNGLFGSPSSPSTQTITANTFGGATTQWAIHWSAPIGFNGGTGTYTCTSLDDVCTSALQENLLTSVDLPSPGGASLSFQFQYNTNGGWGNLKQVQYPSGAIVQYQYKLDNTTTGLGTFFLTNPVVRKEADYTELWDGNSVPHADAWTFRYLAPSGACPNQNTMTAPDQGVDTVCFTGLTRSSEGLSGAIYRHISPTGDIDEKAYSPNVPAWGNGDGGYNPEVAAETHAMGGTAAAVTMHTFDQNGNETQQTTYDFGSYSSLPRNSLGFITGPPPGSALLRTSETGYTVFQPAANTDPATSTSDNMTAYWHPSSPRLLNLAARLVVSGSGSGSAAENTYDPGGTGNLTKVRRWDSTKAAGLPSALTDENSVVEGFTYTGRGNVASVTDGRQISTCYAYDSNDILLTQKTVACGTAQAETFDYSVDPSTGLLANSTDPNGVKTVYNYDSLGRLTNAQKAQGTSVEQNTAYTYDDANLRVISKADLYAKGDLALVSVSNFDPLGRLSLTQELEDSSSQSPTDRTDGIKIETRYLYSGSSSYKLVSNPFRGATSSAAGSACAASPTTCTMGWTLMQYDQSGREVATASYDGSGVPAPWGGNTATSGTATAYNAQSTTVTDEEGNARTTTVDGAGRLVRVVEDPAGYNYSTGYTYDALDSLTGVTQSSQTRSFAYDSLKRLTAATNPESGTVSYKYDGDGNLTAKTDNRNIATTYGYDSLNRIKNKSYEDATPNATYQYDTVPNGIGRLASVSNGNSTTNYLAYDELGRVTSSSQQTAGVTYPFGYEYNFVSSLTKETYPSGRVMTTLYDGANRAKSLAGQLGSATTNYVSQAAYHPHGAIAALSYGNTVSNVYGYDNRLRMSGEWITLNDSDQHYLLAESFLYFKNGNLSSGMEGYGANVPAAGLNWFTQGYTYDGVNRLKSASDNGGWARAFSYDAYGNMTPAAGPGNTIAVPSANAYDASSNRITNNGVLYDGAGNQTAANGDTLTYDAENRQVSAFDAVANDTELYSYDGDGRRVRKQETSGGTGTVFVYDAMGLLAAEYFTPGTSNPCATCYITADRLGSTRLVTDGTATVVARHDYLPFGEEIAASSAGRTIQWGLGNDNITEKFTAKERDSETGLDYFGARYYGSALGRFSSADEPLADQDEHDPQSWNLYAYVRNNPLRYTDRDGRACTYDPTTNNFTGDCSSPGDENVTQGNKPQQTTVGVGSDEANLIMLQGIGQSLTSGANVAQFISDAGQAAGSLLAPGATAVAQCATGINCSKANLALAMIPGALGASGRVIKILEEAGGVVHLQIQTASGTYEVVANITREGDKIVLEGAHIQGTAGQFGPGLITELRAAARQFMQQEGVSEVEVVPGVRTSGANPGRPMRPFTVRAN